MPIQPFAGQPPDNTVTVGQPANRSPSQTTLVGTGNTVTVSSTTVNLPAATTLTITNVNLSSTSGDNTLIAGVASQTVKLYSAVLTLTTSAAVTFKSGTGTSITGPISLAANTPLVLQVDQYPWAMTLATGALVLNLSTTSSVGGSIRTVQS